MSSVGVCVRAVMLFVVLRTSRCSSYLVSVCLWKLIHLNIERSDACRMETMRPNRHAWNTWLGIIAFSTYKKNLQRDSQQMTYTAPRGWKMRGIGNKAGDELALRDEGEWHFNVGMGWCESLVMHYECFPFTCITSGWKSDGSAPLLLEQEWLGDVTPWNSWMKRPRNSSMNNTSDKDTTRGSSDLAVLGAGVYWVVQKIQVLVSLALFVPPVVPVAETSGTCRNREETRAETRPGVRWWGGWTNQINTKTGGAGCCNWAYTAQWWSFKVQSSWKWYAMEVTTEQSV